MRETFTSGSTRGEWVAPLAESPSLLLYRHLTYSPQSLARAAEEGRVRPPLRYPAPSGKSPNRSVIPSLAVAAHWVNIRSITPVQCSRTFSASGSDSPYSSQVRVNIASPPHFSQNTQSRA